MFYYMPTAKVNIHLHIYSMLTCRALFLQLFVKNYLKNLTTAISAYLMLNKDTNIFNVKAERHKRLTLIARCDKPQKQNQSCWRFQFFVSFCFQKWGSQVWWI